MLYLDAGVEFLDFTAALLDSVQYWSVLVSYL